MSMQDRIALTQALEMQLHDYWHEVDFNWGRTAHLYYTEDGRFEGSSGVVYEGRDEIARFYAYRESRGARTAVHAVTNFRAVQLDDDTAEARWFLHLYAADGTPPHTAAPPIVLAAMTDLHKRQPDGSWLCAMRSFATLFRGGVPVTVLPQDTRNGAQNG